MDAEAKKKVVTAAKQAKHAVSNLETATELQAEDLVQTVTQVAKPFLSPMVRRSMTSAAIAVGGAMMYHYGRNAVHSFREKRQVTKLKNNIKKAEQEEREGVDGEIVSGPTVMRRSVK